MVLLVEGEYVIEVGEERYEELGPGDCVLAPREVAHVWAHVGEGTGRLIVALQPAGEIEAFFVELAKLGTSPKREELSRAFSSHGMELVGPPYRSNNRSPWRFRERSACELLRILLLGNSVNRLF